jgi:hypothetical protein
VQKVSTKALDKGVGKMGTADVDYTFHKHLPVIVQRKKFLGRTSPHRAYIQDINIHGGRLFTTEPLTESCLICITFRDPDSDTNRTLCARVMRADCIVFQGKKVFQVYMEFLKLTKHDEVMLQNIFYASPT